MRKKLIPETRAASAGWVGLKSEFAKRSGRAAELPKEEQTRKTRRSAFRRPRSVQKASERTRPAKTWTKAARGRKNRPGVLPSDRVRTMFVRSKLGRKMLKTVFERAWKGKMYRVG